MSAEPNAAQRGERRPWIKDEKLDLYVCEDCGAWMPDEGEPLAHNRKCKFYWTVAADAYVREALASLPEGKEVLYTTLGDGTCVVVARGRSALDLWYDWMKPRLVDAFVAEVRRGYEEAESNA